MEAMQLCYAQSLEERLSWSCLYTFVLACSSIHAYPGDMHAITYKHGGLLVPGSLRLS